MKRARESREMKPWISTQVRHEMRIKFLRLIEQLKWEGKRFLLPPKAQNKTKTLGGNKREVVKQEKKKIKNGFSQRNSVFAYICSSALRLISFQSNSKEISPTLLFVSRHCQRDLRIIRFSCFSTLISTTGFCRYGEYE